MKKIFKLFIVFIVVLSMPLDIIIAGEPTDFNYLIYTLPISDLSSFARKPSFDYLENNYMYKLRVFLEYDGKDDVYKHISYSKDENNEEFIKGEGYVFAPYFGISRIVRLWSVKDFEKISKICTVNGLQDYLSSLEKNIGKIESCYLFDGHESLDTYPYTARTVPTLWVKAGDMDYFMVLYNRVDVVIFTKEEYFNVFCSKGEINCIESKNLFYEYKDKLEEYRNLTNPNFEISINYIKNNTTCKLDKKAFGQYGIIFVPYRDIMEELGYEVSWQNEDKSIHCKNGEKEIILYTDTYEMTIREKDECKNIEIGAFGKPFNGTNYVPLETISKGLGVRTEFDQVKNVVNINVKR